MGRLCRIVELELGIFDCFELRKGKGVSRLRKLLFFKIDRNNVPALCPLVILYRLPVQ
jgi:hypothetical protein